MLQNVHQWPYWNSPYGRRKRRTSHSEDLWRAQEIHSEIGSVCNEKGKNLITLSDFSFCWWFFKCDPWTGVIIIIPSKLGSHVNYWAPTPGLLNQKLLWWVPTMCVLTSSPGHFNEYKSSCTTDLCGRLAGLFPLPISIGRKRTGEKWLGGKGAAIAKEVLSLLGITRMHYFIMDQVGTLDFEPYSCYYSHKGWL